MTADTIAKDSVAVAGAPDIDGLAFRYFRGESDFPKLIAVLIASNLADGVEEINSVEDMASRYSNLKNCDPYKDVVVVEVNGQVVGYKRVTWWEELDGTRIYGHFGFLLPEWRGKGIGRALLRHSEDRLREIAAEHPAGGDRFFDSEAVDNQAGLVSLLAEEGYEPIRYWYEMVRPDLENIPDFELPEGIEARLVQPEQYRAIWEAEVEAFKDHWGEAEVEEADYDRWLSDRPSTFQPHLWQVAWDGDQVVGMVRNFIDEEQNELFSRKRGYTEYISVRRAWRKRGVAKALIARSFRLLKELGMTEAALGVDTENPNGALQLYESMGFRQVKRGASYRKPMN